MAEAGWVYRLDERAPEPLWREALGSRLRALRTERGETLAQTADRAGISPQYLSEIERGRKEPSSEMIAALAGALGSTLIDLTSGVAEDLRRAAGGRLATGRPDAGHSGAGRSGTGRTAAAGTGAGGTGAVARRGSPPVALAIAA